MNPADGLMYAATHAGLYRLEGGRSSIIANRYQDTMGFTIAGPDHFLAGGHPDFREELPPLLGFLESRDAGRTWVKKSLLGKADFHALRFAHGKVWGYNSTTGELMVSSDGRRWDTRSATVLRDFVVSPHSAKVVIASNGEMLQRSKDGGRTWERIDAPDGALLLSWTALEELWLLTVRGGSYRSTDGGHTWEKRGKLDSQPEAFVADGDNLYAATHNAIFSSKDEGLTWTIFFSEGGTTDE